MAGLREAVGVSWRAAVCSFGVLLCVVGLVLQWTQPLDKWHIPSQKLANSYGMHTVFLLIVAVVNLVSILRKRDELLWVSIALALKSVEVCTCVVHDIEEEYTDAKVLVTAFSLVLAGMLLSFVAFPFSLEGLKGGSLVKTGVQILLSVLLLVGSVLVWNGENVCPATGVAKAHRQPLLGMQPSPTNAAVIAVLHLASSVSGYAPGLEVAFIFAAMNVASYEPFNPQGAVHTNWKCDGTCRTGLCMVTLSLLLLVFFHLFASSKRRSGDVAVALARAKTDGVRSKLAQIVLCCVVSFVGMILVLTEKYSGSSAVLPQGHVYAQEGWVAFTMFFVSVLMVVVELTGHHGCAVAAFSFYFSAVSWAVGADGTDHGILGWTDSTQIRVGYILLFLSSFLSFYGLPCEWTTAIDASTVEGPAKTAVQAGLGVFLAVVYLWSESVYEAPLGFASLVLVLSVLMKFEHGLNWAYFIFLFELPRTTPFTAADSVQFSVLYALTNKTSMASALRCVVLGSVFAGCLGCSEDGVSTAMLEFTAGGVHVRDVVCVTGHRRLEGEQFGAWMGRLDEWTQPLEEAPGAGGKIDIVCTGGGASHQLQFENPRVEEFEGEMVELESGYRQVVVPTEVLSAGFRCTLYAAFFHEEDVFGGAPQGRAAHTLATPVGAEARTEQRSGDPADVHNLVFLASGYTAAERPKWEADVSSALKAFRTGDRYGNTMPFVRYLPAINIFSVWQPSPESGASIPSQMKVVDNNLGCSYGKSIDRLLTCNRGLLVDLAEVSDAKPKSANFNNVIALVLVNSDKYGGAGSRNSAFKYGSFYTTSDQGAGSRAMFAAVMFHELAHAWLQLADEYTYGRNGPKTGGKANCISPQLLDNLPWQHLIDAGLVPATPSKTCSYNNWYRASPGCLMRTLGSDTLCPVCKEQGTLAMYDTPTFSITFPSCPLPDEVVHVAVGGEVRLHANKNLTDMGDFTLAWHRVKGSKATKLCSGKACTTELLVTADMLEKGVNTVRLTVADKTPWVVDRADRRAAKMTQTRTFTLKLVDSIDTSNATVRARRCYCAEERGAACRGGASTFSNSGATDVPYYSECAAGGFCELHTTAYEREGDAATAVPDTPVPETPIPDTPAPDTLVPETPIPETPIPDTLVPETSVPDTPVPDTQVPETLVPETSVPDTPVPDTPTPDASVPIPPTGDRSNETESAAVTLTATVTSGGATPPSTGVPAPQGSSVTSSAGERDANASSSLSLGVWVLIIVVSLLAVGALVAAAVVLRRKRKKPAPPSFMDAGFLSPTSTEMTSEDPLGVTVFTSKPVFTL